MADNEQHEIARRVREECIQTAISAYDNASISGLCSEGAFEAAVSAMRMLDLEALVDGANAGSGRADGRRTEPGS